MNAEEPAERPQASRGPQEEGAGRWGREGAGWPLTRVGLLVPMIVFAAICAGGGAFLAGRLTAAERETREALARIESELAALALQSQHFMESRPVPSSAVRLTTRVSILLRLHDGIEESHPQTVSSFLHQLQQRLHRREFSDPRRGRLTATLSPGDRVVTVGLEESPFDTDWLVDLHVVSPDSWQSDHSYLQFVGRFAYPAGEARLQTPSQASAAVAWINDAINDCISELLLQPEFAGRITR